MYGLIPIEGSNPSLSANYLYKISAYALFLFLPAIPLTMPDSWLKVFPLPGGFFSLASRGGPDMSPELASETHTRNSPPVCPEPDAKACTDTAMDTRPHSRLPLAMWLSLPEHLSVHQALKSALPKLVVAFEGYGRDPRLIVEMEFSSAESDGVFSGSLEHE